MFDSIKQNEIDLDHLLNPVAGDYWSEMFLPVCKVVEVTNCAVVTLETLRDNGNGSKSFDVDKMEIYTRVQFSNRWRYGRISNDSFEATSEDITANKCWCNVTPASKHIKYNEDARYEGYATGEDE